MKRIVLITLVAICWLCLPASCQSIIKATPAPIVADQALNDITGILGAFPEEIKLLMSQLQDKKESIIQRIPFTEGKLRGEPVVIANTGIGKVNASLVTILMIEHFRPKAILFTGIAGAINPSLHPGDIVIGTSVAHHDYGALTPTGTERKPTLNPSTLTENPLYFKCDSSLVAIAMKAGRSVVLEKVTSNDSKETSHTPVVSSGVIVTGDVFVSSDAAVKEFRQKMNAEATEMEGAAVAQVSFQQRTPFLVIRSMSDKAGDNAVTDIKTFYQTAARNSANMLIGIMDIQRSMR